MTQATEARPKRPPMTATEATKTRRVFHTAAVFCRHQVDASERQS